MNTRLKFFQNAVAGACNFCRDDGCYKQLKLNRSQRAFNSEKESIMKRTIKISAQVVSFAAIIVLASLSAQQANAQQKARVQVQVQRPDQRVQVMPDNRIRVAPPSEICCTPKLGFSGTIVCNGIRVDHVNRWSPAGEMGLEPGDVIMRVNGRNFRSHAEFQQLLRDTLAYRNGHLDLTVKNIRPYPPVVHVHTDLVHTCGHGHDHGHEHFQSVKY